MFPGASEGKRELGDRIELRKESAGSCGPLRLNSVHFYSQNIQRCSNFLPKKLRRLSDVLPFDASWPLAPKFSNCLSMQASVAMGIQQSSISQHLSPSSQPVRTTRANRRSLTAHRLVSPRVSSVLPSPSRIGNRKSGRADA